MANDPPTSMQMRFGGLDAKDIGVTNFHRPRAASSINRDLKENDAARKLQSEVKKDLGWEPFIKHWIQGGCSAEDAFDMLQRAKMYMRVKRLGASPKTLLRYWP